MELQRDTKSKKSKGSGRYAGADERGDIAVSQAYNSGRYNL